MILYYYNHKNGDTSIVYMVIQAHSYQLFDFVQSVHYIMTAKCQRQNNELCTQAVHSNWGNGGIQTQRFNYIMPVVIKLFNMEEQFY